MIVLEGVHARATAQRGKSASRITNVTLSWKNGVLAVLGTSADGTTALLEVLAGTVPVRGGRATIEGKPPREAHVRVAFVPLEPSLPDALRVDEVCHLAGQLRGEPRTTAVSRLAPLGIQKLVDRRVRSLSRGEIRAVSLAIALTSSAPVLLIEEPLSGLDPAAPARVIEALRERAAAGASVIVTTASVRDATALADQLGMLTQGVYAHVPAAFAHVGSGGARLRVVVSARSAAEVAPFVAALAEESAIASVETMAFAANRELHATVAVIVGGLDLLTAARAVAAAAARSMAKVEVIESAVMPLDAIRSRIAPAHPGMLPPRPVALDSRPPPTGSAPPPGDRG